MGGENFGWLELMLGAVSGAFTMLLMSLLVGVISSRSRKNKEKQKELIGKAVAHMMGKVNELFIAYRLGDLAFEQMERESREYISKITDDINENNGQLSSAYVAVVTRYIEEKTEMLIAIKEDFHHYNTSLQQETVGHINTQPATQVSVHPTTHDAPKTDPIFAQSQQPALNEVPVVDNTSVASSQNNNQRANETVAPAFAQENVTQSFTTPKDEQPQVEESIESIESTQQSFSEPVGQFQDDTPVLDLSDSFVAESGDAPIGNDTASTDTPLGNMPAFDAPVVNNTSNEVEDDDTVEDIFDISIEEEPVAEKSNPISDIALSMQDDDTGAAQPQVTGNNPFGEMDFSATQEFAREELQPASNQTQNTRDVIEPFSLDAPAVKPAVESPVAFNDPALQSSVNEPAPQVSNNISIETDEFTSAIDNAFDLGGGMVSDIPVKKTNADPNLRGQGTSTGLPTPQMGQQISGQPTNVTPSGSQPIQQNPFQGFEAPAQSGFQNPTQQINRADSSKFSLNSEGNLDVEATQEFNLNDIMSQAQEVQSNQPSQNGDDGMVSGDDVASKLDSFFS